MRRKCYEGPDAAWLPLSMWETCTDFRIRSANHRAGLCSLTVLSFNHSGLDHPRNPFSDGAAQQGLVLSSAVA